MKLYRATCDCGQAVTRRREHHARAWLDNHECTREPDGTAITPDDLIRRHRVLATKTAYFMCRTHHASYEEAYADALIGLWQAAKNWDPTRGAKFSTFAVHRMRGAILDGIRDRGPFARSTIATGVLPVVVSLDAPPRNEDDPNATLGSRLVDPDGEDQWVDRLDAMAALRTTLDKLPERTRWIVTEHLSGRTLADIGGELSITESRVCQIWGDFRHLLQQSAA